MALLAFDSASPWDEQRLARIRKVGGIAVSVYIRGTPGGFRHANAADVQLARSHGLGVLPNWESLADWFRSATVAQARAAGVEALNACRALGIPDDGSVSVPFSFDYQMPPAAFAAEKAKLDAAQDGLGDAYRATAYGQSAFLAYLAAHGYGDRGHWLMASTWGLPYAPGAAHVAAVQSHDAAGNWINSPVASTDVNTVTQPDLLGAWWPDGSTFGGNMALSDADAEKVANAVLRRVIYGSGPYKGDTLVDAVRAARGQADTIAQVLGTPRSGVAARVAALQAAVDKLEAAVKAVDADVLAVPSKPVAVDVEVVAQLVDAVKGLKWSAS